MPSLTSRGRTHPGMSNGPRMSSERLRRSRLAELLPAYLGFGAAVVYLLFAALAYARYPAAFSPLNNNWLSDLGNRDLNPLGSDFYVWGCILTGVIGVAFFLSLMPWRRTANSAQKRLLACVLVAGVFACLSLVMSAIYTEDQFDQHQFWSRMINVGFATALFMTPFTFRRPRRRSRALIAVAAAGYCSILASWIFGAVHWLEWPSVGLILVFLCLLGWMSASTPSAESSASERKGEFGPAPG